MFLLLAVVLLQQAADREHRTWWKAFQKWLMTLRRWQQVLARSCSLDAAMVGRRQLMHATIAADSPYVVWHF